MDLKYYASRYIQGGTSPIKKDWRGNMIDQYLQNGANVLDVGCASGGFFDAWKHKNIQYHWIDYNDTLVEYCKGRGLDVVQTDISKDLLPFKDNEFDFVYCSHVLEHLLSNEQILFFREVSRILKKDGVFVLFTPTPYSWYFWDDPTHQRPSTHGSLEHLAKDFGLAVVESKYSNLRFFSQNLQKWLRLPPLRWFLWEVYLVCKK